MFPARRTHLPVFRGLLATASLVLALALAACPAPPPSEEAPDAGAHLAPDAAAEAAPPPLELEVRYQAADAGLALIDFSTAGVLRPSIDPTTQLEVSTNIGLQNYRVRLFDEVDRAMVSDDLMEEPGDRMLYRIQLPAPLKAGHRYTLVVDAQAGSSIADSAGRLYPDQRLEFEVAGIREPDRPTPPPRRQRVTKTKKTGKTKRTTRKPPARSQR